MNTIDIDYEKVIKIITTTKISTSAHATHYNIWEGNNKENKKIKYKPKQNSPFQKR